MKVGIRSAMMNGYSDIDRNKKQKIKVEAGSTTFLSGGMIDGGQEGWGAFPHFRIFIIFVSMLSFRGCLLSFSTSVFNFLPSFFSLSRAQKCRKLC